MTRLIRGLLAIEAAGLLATVSLAVWAWPLIPNGQLIPIHWGLSGQPDGFAPKPVALVLLPAVLLLTCVVVNWRVRREVFAQNLQNSYVSMWVCMGGVYALLAIAQWLIISTALGQRIPVTQVLCAMIGVLFVAIGLTLAVGKTYRNASLGVRTPWTLQDDIVWDKTNRLGGIWMLVLGVVVVAVSLSGNSILMLSVMLGGILLLTICAMIYSRELLKRQQKR